MVRAAKIFSAASAALFALGRSLLGAGSLLPADHAYATSRRVEAPAATVFALIDSQAGLERWWRAAMDAPQAPSEGMNLIARPGAVAGPGMEFEFASVDGVTMEVWTVLADEPGVSVTYRIDFQIFESERTLALDALDADTTEVRWTETAHIDHPLVRWFAWLEGDGVVQNFDAALGALAKVAEAP